MPFKAPSKRKMEEAFSTPPQDGPRKVLFKSSRMPSDPAKEVTSNAGAIVESIARSFSFSTTNEKEVVIDELAFAASGVGTLGSYPAMDIKPTTKISSNDGEKSLNFFGTLNLESMPKEGRCKYNPSPFSKDDIDRMVFVSEKAQPHQGDMLSALRRFNDFLDKNPHISPKAAALAAFAVQAAGSISPAGAARLTAQVVEGLRAARIEVGSLALCDLILQGLELMQAEIGHQHAVDLTDDEARSFLPTEAPQNGYPVRKVQCRVVMWLMLTSGARDADLLHNVERISIDSEKRRLIIEFFVTKTNRTASDKRVVSFPWFTDPDKHVLSILSKKQLSKEDLVDCDGLNYVLKAANLKTVKDAKTGKERSITSYSFRRCFIHRVIRWYTDDDGLVDWMKVIQWTGHKSESIVASTYHQGTNLKIPNELTVPKNAGGSPPPGLDETRGYSNLKERKTSAVMACSPHQPPAPTMAGSKPKINLLQWMIDKSKDENGKTPIEKKE